MKMHMNTFVVLLQFDKPGARDNYDYPDMAKEAGADSNSHTEDDLCIGHVDLVM